jgi:signal transduction histidine kinase
MDVHIVLKKSLIYSLSVSLLTGLFLLLVFLMTKYLTEVIAIPSFTITIICTLIIAFLFTPLKNRVQSFVDKAFYKTTYDYYTTVNRMSHDLALSRGLYPTYKLILDTIVDTLKLKRAYLLSVQDESIEPVYAGLSRQGTSGVNYAAPLSLGVEAVEHAHNDWDRKSLPKDSKLVSVLTGGNILIKEELFTLKDQDAATAIAAELHPYGGEVAVPISIDGNLTFLLILGEKWSSDAFTVEDLNLLSTVSSQASIALKNAKLYDELEMRVRERTAQLTRANNLLQEQNNEIKSFAYIVSHDMRAPLVNIKGFSSELKLTLNELISLVDTFLPLVPHKERKELKALTETAVPKALGFIESSAKRIDVQIGAILKLLRVGRKELHPEQINMVNLFESILGTLTHQIKTSNVKITIGTLPEIVADRSSMEQIIGNLLDNALKYLAPGRDGKLEITSEQNQDETMFHIRDNGRGIAKDDMQKVFEIFRRVGKPDVQGEGMGLAYVKALIKGLGGRIWCESELGVGTTFSFSIPNNIPSGSNSKAFE